MKISLRSSLRPKSVFINTSLTRGIILMALGMFLFSALDTMCIFLTETLHSVQSLWSRQLGLLGGVLIYLSFKGISVLQTNWLGLQILRGFSSIASAWSFIFALRYLPLAEAVAGSFVAPFFVVLMGASILKETVGLRRWLSIIVGLAGALIIIRPSLGVFDSATILVLLQPLLLQDDKFYRAS